MRESNISFMGLDALLLGSSNRGKSRMVFDWVKAAKIIKDRNAKTAEAGLEGDWQYTGGLIWKNGVVEDHYTYLASTWAVPTLIIDDSESIECFVMETDTEWGSDTKWPEEAVAIVSEKTV